MKKSILIVLCILIISCMACCNNSQTYHDDVKPSMMLNDIDMDDNDNTVKSIKFYMFDTSMHPVTYKNHKQDIDTANKNWNDLLEMKYGLYINNINIYTEFSGFIEEINSLSLSTLTRMGMDDGLFAVPYDSFCELIKKHLIDDNFISLESLYENNITMSNIPSRYTDMTKDLDGEVWGIAYDYNDNQMPGRFYDLDMLDRLECGAPKTLDEFYEMCVNFKSVYPDKHVIHYWNRFENHMYPYGDIFGAYGIYGGEKNKIHSSIQYNNDTDSFEDMMLFSEFREALEYIRQISGLGVIGLSYSGEYFKAMDLGNLLSSYDRLDDSKRLDGRDFVPYMITDGHKIMYKYNKCSSVVLIGKNMQNPKIGAGLFSDILNSDQMYSHIRYGNETEQDNQGGMEILAYESLKAPYPMPVGMIGDKGLAEWDNTDGELLQTDIDNIKRVHELIHTFSINEKMKEITICDSIIGMRQRDYSQNEFMWTASVFLKVFYGKISNSEISLDDLYDEYFKEIHRIGGEDYMMYLNDKAGKVWQVKYDEKPKH